jgi:hypothetical protein
MHVVPDGDAIGWPGEIDADAPFDKAHPETRVGLKRVVEVGIPVTRQRRANRNGSEEEGIVKVCERRKLANPVRFRRILRFEHPSELGRY